MDAASQVITSFSLLLYNVFVAASKHKAKRNNTGFILYALKFSTPLNSRVKNKISFNFFSTLGLIAPIKIIKQNLGENIVQCWFYETSIKICD